MGEPEAYSEKHEPELLRAWNATVAAVRPDTAPGR
jgi:hypothetical protein